MRASSTREGFQVVPVPRDQQQIVDWLAVAARHHTMHALLEVDVTEARRAIRQRRAQTHQPLSFTAFVVAGLARAIDEDKTMHAHRKGRHELMLFDDVDVTVMAERVIDGARIPVPYIVRAANRKTPAEISREIRGAVLDPVPYAEGTSVLDEVEAEVR